MRTLMIAVGVMLATAAASIARAEPPAELEPFAFLLGEWPSSGAGQPGAASGTAVFTRSLQDRVIQRTSYADYPATEGRPATRHDDFMIIYVDDAGEVRADYFDSEGHVIRYVVESPGPGEAVFTGQGGDDGFRFRLSYRLAPTDVLHGEFAIAAPGTKEEFKPYLTWDARKTSE